MLLMVFSLDAWSGGQVIVLDRASVHASRSALPPAAEDMRWRLQSLPDNWNVSRPRSDDFLWYQLRFQVDEVPVRLWSIYFPSVSSRVAVYLNGYLLGEGTSYRELSRPAWQQPYSVTIPQGLLKRGNNLLQIRLMPAQPFPGYLGRVYVGEDHTLRPLFAKRFALTVNLPQMIVVLMIALGVSVAMLWWFRRSETQYLWFALTVLAWSAYDGAQFFGDFLPFSIHTRDEIATSGLIWFVVCLGIFSHRFLGVTPRGLERVMLVGAGLGTLAAVLVPEPAFKTLRVVGVDVFLLVLAAYIFARLVWNALKRRSVPVILLAGCLLVGLLFGLHDWLMIMGWVDLEGYLWLHLSAPVLFLAVTFILNRRMTRALDDAEHLALHLEDRVREVAEQFETRLAQARVTERSAVLDQERARIMRDMHDGVGGMLVSAVQALEGGFVSREELAQELRGAVDEFRLIIDSLDPEQCGLVELLANFRARLTRRLQGGTITLDWPWRDLGDLPGCEGQQAIDILRILQEATTNSIKYARASRLTLRAERVHDTTYPERLELTVADDGVGFAAGQRSGKGLKNMAYRAARIGAELSVTSSDQGTTVTLAMPLGAAASQ